MSDSREKLHALSRGFSAFGGLMWKTLNVAEDERVSAHLNTIALALLQIQAVAEERKIVDKLTRAEPEEVANWEKLIRRINESFDWAPGWLNELKAQSDDVALKQ